MTSSPLSFESSALFRHPFAERLAPAQDILIAGAGGGFDIFAGLPLYFALLQEGKRVHLANLSFTYLGATTATQVAPHLWCVDHQSSGEPRYFPEMYLATWLQQNNFPDTIYCFEKVGVQPLRAAYRWLVEQLGIDAILLIDGGTDILMRGDEESLGTPAEDMTSLAAVHGLDLTTKLVSCLGFGIDAFHGVCHAHVLENIAALDTQGGYLGAHSLHLSMPEVTHFRDALEYTHALMPDRQSIVNGSILSALEGRFGDAHRTERTKNSELFINPLMALYWHFDLTILANHNLYLPRLESTEDIFQVHAQIEAFHRHVPTRPHKTIPC